MRRRNLRSVSLIEVDFLFWYRIGKSYKEHRACEGTAFEEWLIEVGFLFWYRIVKPYKEHRAYEGAAFEELLIEIDFLFWYRIGKSYKEHRLAKAQPSKSDLRRVILCFVEIQNIIY